MSTLFLPPVKTAPIDAKMRQRLGLRRVPNGARVAAPTPTGFVTGAIQRPRTAPVCETAVPVPRNVMAVRREELCFMFVTFS
jgi:hypothetical protein